MTTAHGELALRDTGIFDQASGVFSSFDVVNASDSTGKYAGATGQLFIGGETINGQFVTTVSPDNSVYRRRAFLSSIGWVRSRRGAEKRWSAPVFLLGER